MAMNGLRRTLDRLRKALAPEGPDEDSLRAFIALRDETAFATLVRRHGQMVLRASRDRPRKAFTRTNSPPCTGFTPRLSTTRSRRHS
jgi:hypothetical protein